GQKRSRAQERAVAALLTCPTVKQAARVAGIGERTLQGWLRGRSFLDVYRQARRQGVETAMGALQGATRQGVGGPRRDMRCGDPGTEVKAAATVLAQAVRAAELLDLAERVEELERQALQGWETRR